MIDEPRAVLKAEIESLHKLLGFTFRPTMMEEYPSLFNPENWDNLRVCVENGKCVSHVGMKQQDALLYGCKIRTACIGAVGTDTAYRNRGLATRCLEDAIEKAEREGVDMMLVSGDRLLYQSHGCVRIGCNIGFTLYSDQEINYPHLPFQITALPFSDADLPAIMNSYQNEPVRFFRSPSDYELAMTTELVRNRLGKFWLVREGGAFRGYFILKISGIDRKAKIVEYSGERRSLLKSFEILLNAEQLSSIQWVVSRHDELFQSLCLQAGLEGDPHPFEGTVRIIRFSQLMARMQPYFIEKIGRTEAAKLAFREHDDHFHFLYDEHELILNREEATKLLFGTVQEDQWQCLTKECSAGAMWTEILKRIFPIPNLSYGLNYV